MPEPTDRDELYVMAELLQMRPEEYWDHQLKFLGEIIDVIVERYTDAGCADELTKDGSPLDRDQAVHTLMLRRYGPRPEPH